MLDTDAKFDIEPLVTVTSSTVKSVVASEEVNIRVIAGSLEVEPSLTVLLVIVIVGAIVSTS